jgi:hypothetical protein
MVMMHRPGGDGVKPAPFGYVAPTTIEDAVTALASVDGDAKVLAGGQSLIPAFQGESFEHRCQFTLHDLRVLVVRHERDDASRDVVYRIVGRPFGACPQDFGKATRRRYHPV